MSDIRVPPGPPWGSPVVEQEPEPGPVPVVNMKCDQCDAYFLLGEPAFSIYMGPIIIHPQTGLPAVGANQDGERSTVLHGWCVPQWFAEYYPEEMEEWLNGYVDEPEPHFCDVCEAKLEGYG